MREIIIPASVVLLFAVGATAAEDVVFQKSRIVMYDEDGDSKEEKVRVRFTEEGRLVVTDRKEKKVYAELAYADIEELVYERSSHPRAKTAILVSPFALFSKGKKHWLTVTYRVDEREDFLLLRLDKKEYQRLLATAETRTGVEVERVIDE